MKNEIKLYLHKYIFYYIIVIIIFPFIFLLGFNFIRDYLDSKKPYVFDYADVLDEAYRIDPSIFEFKNDKEAVIEMSRLAKPITNGIESIGFGSSHYTEEQDECAGYIIARRKKDNTFDYDYSHICDMIDF